MPGLVKIGLTTRSLEARAAELTAATGVPVPFVIAWGRAVSDCAFVERAVHRMLDDRRVSGKREFFRCDVKTARQVIEAAAGDKLGRRYRAAIQPVRRRRRRRGGDLTGAVLLGSAVAAILVLVFLKPPLGWLPASLSGPFGALERLY
jgi:hypothetical protein